eukprot:12792687-Alexandrium_andersonii.AAC.1
MERGTRAPRRWRASERALHLRLPFRGVCSCRVPSTPWHACVARRQKCILRADPFRPPPVAHMI